MHIYFLGGIFTKSIIEYIHKNSIGPIQNAANALQGAYLHGIEQALEEEALELTTINLPFIGSFPKRFKKINIPYHTETTQSSKIIHARFLNLPVLKIFSRFASALQALAIEIRQSDKHVDKCIVIYSMHLPFMMAAIIASKLNPKTKSCMIILDLPEYMSDNSGYIHRFSRKISSAISYYLAKKIDFLVTITDQMQEKFPDNKNKITIEGMCEFNENTISREENAIELPKEKYILYTGTLDARYGILDLINSFSEIQQNKFFLLICGDGSHRDEVQRATNKNKSIIYLGQLPRGDVLLLQAKASFLINPRKDIADYTKYSFPSKIIEYMASGTPVIMHRLSGVPSEYYNHCITASDQDSGLKKAIEQALKMSETERIALGKKAREFIFNSKNSINQVGKLLKLIKMDASNV